MTIPNPSYTARAIDGAVFELLPDGALVVHTPQGNITLTPGTAYALYLFLRLPGIRPQLRRLDEARQRATWQVRNGSE